MLYLLVQLAIAGQNQASMLDEAMCRAPQTTKQHSDFPSRSGLYIDALPFRQPNRKKRFNSQEVQISKHRRPSAFQRSKSLSEFLQMVETGEQQGKLANVKYE